MDLLNTILETIPMPCFYKDVECRYIGYNNLFSRDIIGLNSSELKGKKIDELFEQIPKDLARKYELQDQRLLENGGTQIYDSDVLCHDDIRRKFRFVKNRFYDQEGNIAGVFGVMIDLKGELYSTQIMSPESHFSEIGRNASYIMHEINGSITRLSYLTKKIQDSYELSEEISSEITKVEKTVKNIRDISSWVRTMSHSSFSEPKELTSVQEILDSCQELIGQEVLESGVELILPKSDSLKDLKVYCRPIQIVQVIVNLLKNASDAVEQESERWINLSVTDKEEKIEFTIKDSGKNFSIEEFDLLLENPTSSKNLGKGSGIGLQVVKKVLRQHGTLIELIPSEHTTLKFSLEKVY